MIECRYQIVSKIRSRDASGKKCQHLNNSLTVNKKYILTIFLVCLDLFIVNFFNVEQLQTRQLSVLPDAVFCIAELFVLMMR